MSGRYLGEIRGGVRGISAGHAVRGGHLQVGVARHERARVDERVVGRRGGGEQREQAVDAPRVGQLAQLHHLRLGERVEDACVVAGREVARAWSGLGLRLG